MRSHRTKWSRRCWSVPDDSDALETEMVGGPELCVWWLAALLSDAVSLEYKLATLSAPSGCIQTQHTWPLLKMISSWNRTFFFFFRRVLLGVCWCCWPWPSGCHCWRTVCLVLGTSCYWGLWASPRTPTPPCLLCKPGRWTKYLKLRKVFSLPAWKLTDCYCYYL